MLAILVITVLFLILSVWCCLITASREDRKNEQIDSELYRRKEGKKIYVTEVVVEKIDFLESKKKEESSGYGHEEEWAQQEKELEEYAEKNPDDPYVQGSYVSNLDIQSDDLPF